MGWMSRRQKLIATAPSVNPSAFSCSRSSNKACSSSMPCDANWLVHFGYETGAHPVLVGSTGVGLSM
jgi:hypothetical protein